MLKVSLQTNVEGKDLLILRGLRKKNHPKFAGEERKENIRFTSLVLQL